MALRERMPAVALSRRGAAALSGLVAALAGVSALVAAGSFTRLDQFSVDHWMPWLEPGSPAKSSSAGFYRPFTFHTSNWAKLLDVWTYPNSVLISGLAVVAAAVVFRQRLGLVAALAPATAWVVGNAIEVLGKATITRPALYGQGDNGVPVHVGSFDGSFPSGHSLRCVIVGYVVVLLWPRLLPWVLMWAALVGPALVFESAHTPTDVVGGLLLGLALLVLMTAVVGNARRERAPIRPRQAS